MMWQCLHHLWPLLAPLLLSIVASATTASVVAPPQGTWGTLRPDGYRRHNYPPDPGTPARLLAYAAVQPLREGFVDPM